MKSEYAQSVDQESIHQSKYEIDLPQSVIDSFARFLVPEIRKYYESEEGQKAFEHWQEESDT